MNEACIPDTPQYVVAALYQFVELADFADLKPVLERLCEQHEVVGTLLLAREGINGTVCGPRAGIVALLRHLWADPRFAPLQPKYSLSPIPAFIRMKVKLKQEIVTMGKQSIDPKRLVGRYVPPQDWNALIADPGTLVVDTRNHYEYAIGTFAGALDPNTSTFREFPTWVENTLNTLPAEQRPKRIAMFCTGGIRCEKATAYMLEQGFEEVYHLQGGILKYLEEVPPEQSLWQGQCFVFDQRVAVGHGLEIADYTMCHGCRMPLSEEDRASEFYEEGVHCPHCYPKLSDEQKLRFAERQKQVQLAKARGDRHVGPKGKV